MARQRGQGGQGGQNPFNAAAAAAQVAWAQKLNTANAALVAGVKEQEQAYKRLTLGFGLATAAMGGWVRAGIAGTTIGERLSWQTKQLSMQIASLFVPWIEKGIAALQGLTDRFRALSGEQQKNIAWWAAIGTGMLGALAIAPKLITAFDKVGAPLITIAMANPWLAAVAGIVALLASTERGRAALGQLGQSLLEAFQPVAKVLLDLLVPAMKSLASLIATGGELFAKFGASGLLALGKLAEAVENLRKKFALLRVGIDVGTSAFLTVFNEIAKRFEKNDPFKDLEEKVRSGQMTREQAEAEVRRRAQEQAEREAEARGEGHAPLDVYGRRPPRESREDFTRRRREELEKQGLEGLPKGRRDVVPAITGTEDARATIRRLEESILKTGTAEATEKNTRETADTLKEMWRRLREGAGNKDNRDNPPKTD